MQERTHIAMTRLAGQLAAWPVGLLDYLAEGAAHPDRARVVEIEDLGFHALGHGFNSLLHFGRAIARPQTDTAAAGVSVIGYNWKHDKSAPYFDFPDRAVLSRPEGWGWPLVLENATAGKAYPIDPLTALLAVDGVPKAADEISYPAASSMADWCERVLMTRLPWIAAKRRPEAVTRVVSWACHFVQDLCVPHHAAGLLLAGHSEFEGGMHEEWAKVDRGIDVDRMLREFAPVEVSTFRGTAERCSMRSFASRTILTGEWVMRIPWRARQRSSILMALSATIRLLRYARTAYLERGK